MVETTPITWVSNCEPILTHNEYLLAMQGSKCLASVPDLICAIDADTAQPVTAESVRYGQRLIIIGIDAPELMLTETALSCVGPQAFGFDLDFVPIARLALSYN